MKFCSKCGNELMDEAVICPKCGCAVEVAKKDGTTTKDIVLAIIGSILLPIGGIIMFFYYMKKKPKLATVALVVGLVTWVGATIFLLNDSQKNTSKDEPQDEAQLQMEAEIQAIAADEAYAEEVRTCVEMAIGGDLNVYDEVAGKSNIVMIDKGGITVVSGANALKNTLKEVFGAAMDTGFKSSKYVDMKYIISANWFGDTPQIEVIGIWK